MKYLITFLLIFNFGFSQNEKLFYYAENDSLLGVKNQNGKIIIPAKESWDAINYGENILEIKTKIFPISSKKNGEQYFNRKGEYLFDSFTTTEGYDYINQGYIRYKLGNKCGLADDDGNKITIAKYDYLSSINFGFASYCNGCYFDTEKDKEHPPLVGGEWGYIDRNGNEISPTKTRNHPKDFEIKKNIFIPYQFKYNLLETEILSFFDKKEKIINKIYDQNCINCPKTKNYFEIIKKPTKAKPYYKIKFFEVFNQYIHAADEMDDYRNFEVSSDGKIIYALYYELVNHENYSEYIEKKILVDDWLNNELKK